MNIAHNSKMLIYVNEDVWGEISRYFVLYKHVVVFSENEFLALFEKINFTVVFLINKNIDTTVFSKIKKKKTAFDYILFQSLDEFVKIENTVSADYFVSMDFFRKNYDDVIHNLLIKSQEKNKQNENYKLARSCKHDLANQLSIVLQFIKIIETGKIEKEKEKDYFEKISAESIKIKKTLTKLSESLIHLNLE